MLMCMRTGTLLFTEVCSFRKFEKEPKALKRLESTALDTADIFVKWKHYTD